MSAGSAACLPARRTRSCLWIKNGAPMLPLAQFYLPALPYVPQVLDGSGLEPDVVHEILELKRSIGLYYSDVTAGLEYHNCTKFGGYPSFCQSGVSFDEGFQFVFQISSDEKAGFNVIDGGSLMFAKNPRSGAWSLYYDFD